MKLNINNNVEEIDSDHFSLADFSDFDGENVLSVKDYFWAFYQDTIAKKFMVYGNPVSSAPGAKFEVYDRYQDKERSFLNFCSYNYLGYSQHPEVIKEVQKTIDTYGTGAVSAPLLSGYYDITQKLERAISAFKNKEDAIIFPTGYGANLGVLSCLLKRGDVAVLDILSHASIYDGARLAGADIKVFSHNSAEHLETVLKNLKGRRVIVCLEGVYSMDGDLVKLPEIVEVCKRYGAIILLDEAHATLLFGENGRGVAEHFNLEDQIDITVGTFSKSFGAIGGFATGDKKLITYLKMFARSYVFSCAMAPHTAAGIIKVLDLYKEDKSNLKKMWENTRYMQRRLKEEGFDTGDSDSQVIPIMVGSDLKLRDISKFIYDEGLYTGIVTYPAVSNKRTRLRLSMSSNHTKEQMDECIDIVKRAFNSVL